MNERPQPMTPARIPGLLGRPRARDAATPASAGDSRAGRRIARAAALVASMAMPLAAMGGDGKIDFAKGQWDRAPWTALTVAPARAEGLARLPPTPLSFGQEDRCIRVAFTKEDVQATTDNALMVMDTGNPQGEFEVIFTIGKEKGTAPGVCLSPTYSEDRVLKKCIAVFVADYTMAVWLAELDESTRLMKYTQLARLVRWQDPGQKHTLRCRYEKGYFVLRLDDSDGLHFRYPPDFAPNSTIGLWGCHGTCEVYALELSSKGTLPTIGSRPTTR